MTISQWAVKTFQQLTVEELFDVLQLRVDVFVVEQHCAYRELEEYDRHPEARHLSGRNEGGELIAYARLLPPAVRRPGEPGRDGNADMGARQCAASRDPITHASQERQEEQGWHELCNAHQPCQCRATLRVGVQQDRHPDRELDHVEEPIREQRATQARCESDPPRANHEALKSRGRGSAS